MGRRKRMIFDSLASEPPISYTTQPVEIMCPTLHKVTTSNEMHLFDLASIQLELERVLTSTMERLQCLTAEAKGKSIPAPIINSLQLRSSAAETTTSAGRPSLVVKANPNKPLTLIISQQNRSIHSQPPVPLVPEPQGSSRAKHLPSPVCLRKVNKYSHKEHMEQNLSATPEKNQTASGYAIPNKFWELMEPYCAELTEANISFLEGLIRSYQDMESTYFQLPPLRSPDVPKAECSDPPAPKRPKRETVQISNNQPAADAATNSEEPISVTTSSGAVQRAQLLEAELSNPITETSAFGKFSLSLLYSCYQENIVFSFTQGVKRLSEESDKHRRSNPIGFTYHDCDDPSAPSSSNEAAPISDRRPESTCLDTALHSEINYPFTSLPDEIRHLVTVKASQPLKALAKEMHVSSSYRVEKKISQAVAELGLIPLNVMLSPEPHGLSPIHPPLKVEDQCSSKPNLVTSVPEDKSATKSLELTLSARHATPAVYVNSGFKGRSGASRTPVPSFCTSKLDPSTGGDAECNRSSTTTPQTNCVSDNAVLSVPNKANNRPCILRSRGPHRSLRKKKRRLRIALHSTTGSTMQNGCSCTSKAIGARSSFCDSLECNGAFSSDDGLEVNDKVVTASPTACEHLTANKRAVPSDCGRSTGDGEDCHTSDTDSSSGCSFHDALNSDSLLAVQAESNGLQSLKIEESTPALFNGIVRDPNQRLSEDMGDRASGFQTTSIANHFTGTRWEQDDTSQASKPCKDNFLCSMDVQSGDIFGGTDSLERKCADSLCPHGPSCHRDVSCKGSTGIPTAFPDTSLFREMPSDEIGRAILQRQRELRVVCAENHGVLRRLVQAARRDMQRQEIQRRLAIADADVIEAYNRLESYRPQRKPPLKRDRDIAYKALRERCKILKELEAFDAKSP